MLFFLSSYVFVLSVLTTLHGLRVRWNFPRHAARLSLFLSFSFSLSLSLFFRFFFIRIVDVTRAIQRNLLSSRRLFPSVPTRNCRPRESLEFRKKRSRAFFFSSLFYLSMFVCLSISFFLQSKYNSMKHLSFYFHSTLFFYSTSPVASLT